MYIKTKNNKQLNFNMISLYKLLTNLNQILDIVTEVH